MLECEPYYYCIMTDGFQTKQELSKRHWISYTIFSSVCTINIINRSFLISQLSVLVYPYTPSTKLYFLCVLVSGTMAGGDIWPQMGSMHRWSTHTW